MNLVFRKFTFRVYTVVYTVECRGRFSVDHRNKLCLDEHSYPYSTSKPKHVEEKQIDIFVFLIYKDLCFDMVSHHHNQQNTNDKTAVC